MKRIVITLALILTTMLGFAQATSVETVRIQNATTPFDRNLPISTRVVNVATGERWITNTGVAGTANLTTASGSFDSDSGGSESTTVSNTAEIELTLTGNDITGDLSTAVKNSLGLADTALQSFTEVDGSITNEIQTLDQSQLNGKTLELSLLNDGEATKTIDLSSVNYTVLTESFEEDDGTATAHALTQTAITGLSATVSINGTVLKPASYTFTTTTLTIGVPVSQYDQVVITYSY